MESPFLEDDKKMSEILAGKIVSEIKHIDNDCCIQITFSDNCYIILDVIGNQPNKCNKPYSPLLMIYDENDDHILWFDDIDS